MKRKIITAIVTAALVLSLGTGAMAASQGHGGGGCQGRYFVDEDGDGVCDNAGSYCRFVDEDGDGVCDNAGTYCRFVDEDGDGVCDNFGTHHHNSGRGNVRGKGCHR